LSFTERKATMIETRLSTHAERQAKRRGVAPQTLNSILTHSDRSTAQQVEVALALREKGWVPYRVRFEPEEGEWIAKVVDWGQAA
jgi:hypothetical protein